MKSANYMNFSLGHHGALDRVGGLPTHLPTSPPVCEDSGELMGFLGQFYCAKGRLELPGIRCVQLYQCLGSNEDPLPEVVLVPINSPENTTFQGVPYPGVTPHDISWVQLADPDSRPTPPRYDDEELRLATQRLAGHRFLLMQLDKMRHSSCN